MEEFKKELHDYLANYDLKARTVEPISGRIVLPVDESVGDIASIERQCIASGAPFDASQVKIAYEFGRRRQESANYGIDPADVVVVDNGFYGADNSVDIPFEGSPFPEGYFRKAGEGTIARKISIGGPMWPINTRPPGPVSSVQGHGTHVTGLVLGGPTFEEFRTIALDQNRLWGRVSILNVSNGQQALADGALTAISEALTHGDARQIVNMSIAYDGKASRDISTTFSRMITDAGNSLFIVAAGNDGEPLSELLVYPAALGGVVSSNVVTVAALDGNNRLTSFSNFGADSVDLAAPGCKIASWITNSNNQVELSGTSQATPIVTFAASLAYSLMRQPDPRELKTRLAVSGDLLDNDESFKLTYLVRLDIPKTLYVFDDYLSIDSDSPAKYLGTAKSISGISCKKEEAIQQKTLASIWSLKRKEDRSWVFPGRNIGGGGTLLAPCRATLDPAGILEFDADYEITSAGMVPLRPALILTAPVTQVNELIMRANLHH